MTFSRVAVLSDGVHRSTGEWTPSVHAVLRALEGSGIAGIPRVLGFDEQRREMLSFVDGVVPDFPTPPCLWTDAAVTSSASLLRELHDASAPLVVALTGDEVRRSPIHEPVEVICHNDFAPYNLAYRDGICVGAIDFDTVSPGPRLWDLAYFAYRIVPLTAPGTEDDVDLSTSEREHRLQLLSRRTERMRPPIRCKPLRSSGISNWPRSANVARSTRRSRTSRVTPSSIEPTPPISPQRSDAPGPRRQDGVMAEIANSKLTVIGAGSVGSSLAYAALIRQSARTVALYDIQTAKVEAEVLDLAHGTQFTGSSEIIGGDDLSVIEGSHVVVITAGAKQEPGQTRLELAGTNVRILQSMMPQLLEHAPDATYILVTNPCDVLTVIAQKISGLPVNRVFASGTVLDTSRLRWELGRRLGVSTSSIHAYIVGEHGDTEFPLWSSASVGPVPLLDWSSAGAVTEAEFDGIAVDVRDAAYKVINGKGATNYAIGLSGARIVEAVLRDEHAVMPVSTVLDDYQGISGVALSVPSVVSAAGAVPVAGTPYSEKEHRLLHDSAAALRTSLASLGF